MKIVEKTENFLKLENRSSKILYEHFVTLLLTHSFFLLICGFLWDGLIRDELKEFDKLLIEPLYLLKLVVAFLISNILFVTFIFITLWVIINFWRGKMKIQKYLIFNTKLGKLYIKNKGLFCSDIKTLKLDNIKQVEIFKTRSAKYKTRLVLKSGKQISFDLLNHKRLSYQKEIAQSINQFLNISPEPDLVVEDDSENNAEDNQVVEDESINKLNDSPQDRIEKRRTNYLENQKGWWF